MPALHLVEESICLCFIPSWPSAANRNTCWCFSWEVLMLHELYQHTSEQLSIWKTSHQSMYLWITRVLHASASVSEEWLCLDVLLTFWPWVTAYPSCCLRVRFITVNFLPVIQINASVHSNQEANFQLGWRNVSRSDVCSWGCHGLGGLEDSRCSPGAARGCRVNWGLDMEVTQRS